MKRFLIAAFALAAVYISPAVFAQSAPTVPAVLDVNWALPTQSACLQSAPATCVRVPLAGQYALTAVHLYVSQSPIPDNFSGEPAAVLGAGATTTSYDTVVPNGSTLYVRVKAVNAFGVSVFSSEGSKVIVAPAAPAAPTGVTITLTIGT